MERASILYNPAARTVPPEERLRLAAALMRLKGWDIDVIPTEYRGHATDLAREAAQRGWNAVIACGGDGTLNEVVNGVANTPTAVGIIRGGMGNVFAKEIGVPRPPELAIEALLAGERQQFDLGIAGDRYFLLMCGVGFDAEIINRVPLRTKRLLGSSSYALWGAAGMFGYESRRVAFSIDGVKREEDLYWLLLGNTRSYGGVINIASRALANDGLLDAYIYSGKGLTWAVRTGLWIALRRADRHRGVTYLRLADVDVSTPGVPVQADGEYFGETPMHFGVAPGALSVLMPRGSRGWQLMSDETVVPREIGPRRSSL